MEATNNNNIPETSEQQPQANFTENRGNFRGRGRGRGGYQRNNVFIQ